MVCPNELVSRVAILDVRRCFVTAVESEPEALRIAGLLIDELAADIVFVGEVAEGLCAGKGIESEALSLLVVEGVGGAGSIVGQGPLRGAGGRMVAHVCFLLMTGVLVQAQCREEADALNNQAGRRETAP